MSSWPGLLLAQDRAVTWPTSRGVVRRVPGPDLEVPEGVGLTWLDPLDVRPQVGSHVAPGPLPTFVTAVEWPDDHPEGMSGAALCLGDSRSVATWDPDGEEFSVDRGVGLVVLTDRLPAVEALLEDLAWTLALVAAVRERPVRPVDVDGVVVGVAFHCGMGASTTAIHRGLDGAGRTVALLADLELLHGAVLADDA